MTDEALHQWGWRIPFLLGSLIAAVGWYLRTHIPESPAFEQAREAGALSASPIREVFTHQRIPLTKVIGLVWLHGVGFYLLFVYLTTYLSTVTTVPLATVLMMNTACMLLLAVLIPLMGRLSDTVGQKPLLLIGAGGLAITAYPSFIWLTSEQLPRIWAAYVSLTVLMSCYLGPFFAVVVALFPTAQRYTGLSAGYNIAAALFGGTAPLMATLLIEWSGNILSPSLYLSLCAVISLSVILTLRETIPMHASAQ
ncbi:MAG TPA: MFS transporter, partial [Nitrospiraceae bacterium]|nr:MFS transporter [Nitrospiraceae bacterium]